MALIVDNPLANLPPNANLTFTTTTFWPASARLGEGTLIGAELLGGFLLHVGVLEDREDLFVHGSAVLVAPGVAIWAKHVFEQSLTAIKAQTAAIYCGSITENGLELWQGTKLQLVDNSDLAILILKYVTFLPPGNGFRIAGMTARMPAVGARVAIAGFCSSDQVVSFSTEGVRVRGEVRLSLGSVTAQYPKGRGYLLPGPWFEVACHTQHGVSGGPVFDESGRVVGILSSGLDGGPSYVSLLWPALLTPVKGGWPPDSHAPGIALADPGARCSIEYKDRLKRVGDNHGVYGDRENEWRPAAAAETNDRL